MIQWITGVQSDLHKKWGHLCHLEAGRESTFQLRRKLRNTPWVRISERNNEATTCRTSTTEVSEPHILQQVAGCRAVHRTVYHRAWIWRTSLSFDLMAALILITLSRKNDAQLVALDLSSSEVVVGWRVDGRCLWWPPTSFSGHWQSSILRNWSLILELLMRMLALRHARR